MRELVLPQGSNCKLALTQVKRIFPNTVHFA